MGLKLAVWWGCKVIQKFPGRICTYVPMGLCARVLLTFFQKKMNTFTSFLPQKTLKTFSNKTVIFPANDCPKKSVLMTQIVFNFSGSCTCMVPPRRQSGGERNFHLQAKCDVKPCVSFIYREYLSCRYQ